MIVDLSLESVGNTFSLGHAGHLITRRAAFEAGLGGSEAGAPFYIPSAEAPVYIAG